MIIQLVAIAGILFTGLKKTETVIEGEYIPRDEAETAAQSPVVKTGAAVTVASLHKSASLDDLRKKNVIALSALGLASAGFVFQPLNLLSVPLVLYASKDIFKLAWLQLKQGKASVHTLITIITAGIFFIPGGFFLAALVANLFIWSTKLTNTLTAKSRQEIAEIFENPPEYVWLVMDNLKLKTPYEQIKPGDILAVHAGNSIPADGVIVPAVVPDSRKIQKNMDTTLFLMLTPAAISVGGVFLLHFGLAQTIVLNMVGLAAGLGNSMLPALTHQIDKEEPKIT